MTGKDCTPAQIVYFARICSEKPSDRPSWRDKWQAAKLNQTANYCAAIDAIRRHVRMDCWPKFWERKEESGAGSRNNGIPWVLSIITNLTRNGHTLEEALHLPEAQAIWLSTSSSIVNGARLDVLTSEDEELLDELARVGDPPPAQ